MRLALVLLCLFPLPARAWDFAPTPVCTLTQDAFGLSVRVTFDPATALYGLTLARPQGWPDGPVFALRFDGAAPLTISTDRHTIDGAVLSVTDRGFGNVLAGLEGNHTATAILGDVTAAIDLRGAAGPVAAFRACPAVPAV